MYKIRIKVDLEKQNNNKNTHPPLITEDDFRAVQELMKKKGTHKSNGKESLFAHIAKCAECGSGMHFKPDRRKGAYVCGGYLKFTTAHCSSHIIEESILLQTVKDDLRDLIKDSVKLEKLYGIAEKKASSVSSNFEKEIKQTEKQLKEVNKRFDNILTLHTEWHITIEQFKAQNEQIAQQQKELAVKKAELLSALSTRKDTTEELQFFKKEVEHFANLDIDDEQVLKQVLQRLINKIEVYEEGKVKIHYNLSPSLSS